MVFRAKRLRVQLPCNGEDSIVEEAGDDPRLPFCPLAAGNSFLTPYNCPFPATACHPGIPSIADICPGNLITNPCPYSHHPGPGGHWCYLVHTQPPPCHLGSLPMCQLNISAPPDCLDSCVVYYGTHVLVKADRGVMVDADFLPVIRRQLEARLAETDFAAAMTKEQIGVQLDQIDAAEQALRRRSAEEE